jgi:flagellar biosynthesis GTPase FlhF
MTSKKELFNWSGIKDNEDGTFTVKSKIEKRRLLKSLHKQGVAIRSKRNDNGTITVSSIGLKPSGKRVGHRPRLQYPPTPNFRHGYGNPSQYFYHQGSPRPPFRKTYPRALPLYTPPPKPHMTNNISRKVEEWARQRIEKRNREQEEKLLQKKNAEEINEKMRRERIESERKQTANAVRSQETRAKLLKERQQHKRHENAERMRSNIADMRRERIERERKQTANTPIYRDMCRLDRERIESERKQTANAVRSQRTHAKLLKERQQHERHENAERMRSNIADNYGRGPSNSRSKSIDHNELSAQRTEAIENRSNL